MAATYEGGDPAFLERIAPGTRYLEITPDSLAVVDDRGRPALRPEALDELKDLGSSVTLLVHGVGLSIGTAAGWNENYLRLLDQLLPYVPVAWHSEHLGFTEVAGEHLGTMLALPRTRRMLEVLCDRITRLKRQYGLAFLVENIAHMLPDAPAEFTEAGFLNQLASESGCGLILDIYNLECDAHNYRFDIPAFFGELNFGHVRELHLAGGVLHRGMRLDVHSRLLQNSTLELARYAVNRSPNLSAVTYELLPQAVPVLGYEAIAAELRRIDGALQA